MVLTKYPTNCTISTYFIYSRERRYKIIKAKKDKNMFPDISSALLHLEYARSLILGIYKINYCIHPPIRVAVTRFNSICLGTGSNGRCYRQIYSREAFFARILADDIRLFDTNIIIGWSARFNLIHSISSREALPVILFKTFYSIVASGNNGILSQWIIYFHHFMLKS